MSDRYGGTSSATLQNELFRHVQLGGYSWDVDTRSRSEYIFD